jgi:hypothetical protein
MTTDQFRELCRSASYELNLSDPDALYDGSDVYVDSVKIGVLHEPSWDEKGIYCYVDLGAIETTDSSAHSAELFQEILSLNLELDAEMGEVIGIERESGHLVLRARLTKDHVDGNQLAAQLKGYAELVTELYAKVLPGVMRPVSQG